ncbi:hypothetical protein P8935_12180 [Telmatobacter sp. DSM 110680]|uniref:Sel1 repeat family protein n=1 Tax=Telmatobacter sp. DSM 110680 TaxID=3036704 RepID=A0AAU7DRI0_9BACT
MLSDKEKFDVLGEFKRVQADIEEWERKNQVKEKAERCREAAEQGDAEAQFHLGERYKWGVGVPQDHAEAYFWFEIAEAGLQDTASAKAATEARDQAASYLSPVELSSVQERARKWFEDHPSKIHKPRGFSECPTIEDRR